MANRKKPTPKARALSRFPMCCATGCVVITLSMITLMVGFVKAWADRDVFGLDALIMRCQPRNRLV